MKALVRLRGCAGSPEPSLFAYAISTIISWAGSNIYKLYFYKTNNADDNDNLTFTIHVKYVHVFWNNRPQISERPVWANSTDQSDQGLRCVSFSLHLFDTKVYSKSTLFKFRIIIKIFSRIQMFWFLLYLCLKRLLNKFQGLWGVLGDWKKFYHFLFHLLTIPSKPEHITLHKIIIWAATWQNQQWAVRPVKTEISLGIRPVWSESSLSAWRNLGSLATHWAHCKDSDQTGRMPRLIRVFAGPTLILLVL